MEPNNENEAVITSDAKIMVGARVPTEGKQDLILESQGLGITLSENIERVLMNRHKVAAELLAAQQQIETERLKIEAVQQEFERFKGRHFDVCEQYKNELLKKQSELLDLNAIADLLKDERLLMIFNELKGLDDEIKNARGENFKIKYNSAKEVLIAMIYSFQLKK